MSVTQIEIDCLGGDDILLRRPQMGSYLLEMEIIDSEGEQRHVSLNGPALRDALTLLFGAPHPHY